VKNTLKNARVSGPIMDIISPKNEAYHVYIYIYCSHVSTSSSPIIVSLGPIDPETKSLNSLFFPY